MRKQFVKAISATLAAAVVMTGAPMQTAQAAPVKKEEKKSVVVEVTTQEELEAALENPKVTEIKIKTTDKVELTIPKGNYEGKKMVVNAPNAQIVNKGVFDKVAIRGEESATWVEKAKGNTFVVTAKDSEIVIGKNASVEKIAIKKEGSQTAIEIKGTVEKVNVKAEAEVSFEGKTEEVKVQVSEYAEGTTIKSNVPVQVTAKADVKVELGEGAENSTVTTTSKDVKAEIKNETKTDVTVTTPDGSGKVEAGKESTTDTAVTPPASDKKDDSTNTDNGNTNAGGSSGGDGSGITENTKSNDATMKAFQLENVKVAVKKGTITLSGEDVKVENGVINSEAGTVTVEVTATTDQLTEAEANEVDKAVTAKANITTSHEKATVDYVNETEEDFTSEKTITVKAENGTTKAYKVKVNVTVVGTKKAEGEQSSDATISTFNLTDVKVSVNAGNDAEPILLTVSEPVSGVVDSDTKTITVDVEATTNELTQAEAKAATKTVTAKANVTTSNEKAKIDYDGTELNFAEEEEKNITVIAEDGTTKTYTITVNATVKGTKAEAGIVTITGMVQDTLNLYLKDDTWKQGCPETIDKFGNPDFGTVGKDEETGNYKYAPTGTIKKVSGFKGFNLADSSEQEGYYLPIQFEVPEGVDNFSDVKVTVAGGNKEAKTFNNQSFDKVGEEGSQKDVFSLFLYLGADKTTAITKNFTITIDWDGDEEDTWNSVTYEINSSRLTCTDEPEAKEGSVTITSMSPEVLALYVAIAPWSDGCPKAITDIGNFDFTNVTEISEGYKYTLSGTAKKVSDFKGFNLAEPSEQEGYYLPIQFEVPEGVDNYSDVKVTVAGGNKSAKAFNYSNFDGVTINGNQKNVFSLFLYLGADDAAVKEKNFTLTVDWDGDANNTWKPVTYELKCSELSIANDTSNPVQENVLPE